jgi:4-aminobutyrate aminotransferase-like enzyme
MGMAGFGQASPGIVRLPNYHCHRCHLGLQYPGCDIACARFVEKVIEEEGEDTILAFIAEPVQGAAGVVWPPDEYWPMVKKILSDHNILFIADEVQSGFCRTGKFWGVDNWNIVPDIMTMSKGINSSYLPLAAVGFSDRINDALPDSLVFASGTTASANAAVMASGRAALKIFKGQKLAERSAKLGTHLHERLVKEFLSLPCVDNVMGRGLFQSFEIALNKTTGSPFNLEAAIKARESIFSRCLEKGVFAAKYDGYPRRQCVCPALVITEAELDAALDAMLSVMKEVKPV